jgi:hypothetical protein
MPFKAVHNERLMHVPSSPRPWASALKYHKALPSGHLVVCNKPNNPPPFLRELLICERTVGLVHLYHTYKATNPLYLTQFTIKY